MSGQLATSETILVSAAGVIAADSAGLSSVKSYSALLTSIAAMPLAGGTFTGNVLFTDNTYDIGASGATRPRTVYAGTSVITPVLNNTNSAALTIGNSTYGVAVPGPIETSSYITTRYTGSPIIWNIGCLNSAGSAYKTVVNRNDLGTILTASTGIYGWNSATSFSFNSGLDTGIGRSAAGVVELNNGSLVGQGGSYAGLMAAAATFSGVVSHGVYTVATLPAAGSNAGKMAQVTDSNVAAAGNFGATVAGGGANRVSLFCDGTNWVIA